MSSTEYSAEIKPDPRLRRLVAGSGALLGLVGILVILGLPAEWWIRLALSAAWLAASVREQRVLQRGWAACVALRFSASGEISLLEPDREWHPASLANGGILLRKLGWIRLKDRQGTVFSELLRGDDRASPDWRRLQVIWRHVGA